MRSKKILRTVVIAAAAMLFASVPAFAAGHGSKKVVEPGTTFRGTIVTFNGYTRGFTLRINGFTSEKASKQYLGDLRAKGQDGFYKAINKQDLGYFALNGKVGHDLRYVTETPTEAGTRITAVFDRWIWPFELRYGTRSTDYPFTYIELFVKNNGKVTGTIIGAARVRVRKQDPNAIDFENFAAYPAELTGVSVTGKNAA